MPKKRQDADGTTYHIIDKSGDPDFYVRFPKIAWALARDTYDYTFYGVVKDIAGDTGECWLATEDLAALCMMSTGKIADCRDYWLTTGLIQGELVQVGELKSLWHLSIKNIWEENRQWARAHTSIDSRLEFKREQGKAKPKTEIQKTCKRCGVTFITTGRRTRRCPECQGLAEQEQKLIWDLIRQPSRRYIKADDACVMCEGCDGLELHLNFDTKKLSVICANCHDLLHAEVHAMNFVQQDDGSSCHELPITPHELPDAPHELRANGSSWHETKNNHLRRSRLKPKEQRYPADLEKPAQRAQQRDSPGRLQYLDPQRGSGGDRRGGAARGDSQPVWRGMVERSL